MPDHRENIAEAAAPLNRDIENFLLTSEFLELDFDYGFQQLNIYLQDLMFLRSGGKFKDLGISERRHSVAPRLIIPSDASFTLVDKWDLMDNNTPPGSIALLKLSGVMRSQSAMSSPGVDRLASDLRSAYNNQNVKGIILETVSGGGETMAGNMLKSALTERNKPVVGFGHLGASAAYRALSGTDEIIAAGGGAEFGSIGTMISLDNKVIAKLRDRFTEIYGADTPNKNGEFRKALAGDYSGLQDRVNQLTKSFHDEIKKDRPLQGDSARIKDTLSGAMFSANEAKSRGLVDAIGNLNFAVRRVNALQSKY